MRVPGDDHVPSQLEPPVKPDAVASPVASPTTAGMPSASSALTQSTNDVGSTSADAPPSATVGAFAPPVAASPAASSAGTAAAGATALYLQSNSGMAGVAALLAEARLESYQAIFETTGYDDAEFILSLDEQQITQMISDVGFKPGHAQRFMSVLKKILAAQAAVSGT